MARFKKCLEVVAHKPLLFFSLLLLISGHALKLLVLILLLLARTTLSQRYHRPWYFYLSLCIQLHLIDQYFVISYVDLLDC